MDCKDEQLNDEMFVFTNRIDKLGNILINLVCVDGGRRTALASTLLNNECICHLELNMKNPTGYVPAVQLDKVTIAVFWYYLQSCIS